MSGTENKELWYYFKIERVVLVTEEKKAEALRLFGEPDLKESN